jgi:hypothetical protein
MVDFMWRGTLVCALRAPEIRVKPEDCERSASCESLLQQMGSKGNRHKELTILAQLLTDAGMWAGAHDDDA